MKPQARIQATIDILDQRHTSRVPMDTVVGDYMRRRRYIGSKDRSDIAERVYGILRHHARLNWWLNRHQQEDTARNRVLTYLALCEQANTKRINDLCDGSKYAPEPLSETEQTFISAIDNQDIHHIDMDLAVKVECPPLYEQALRDYFGEDFEAEMAALIPGATLDMRVNTILSSREKAQNYLDDAGIKTEHTRYSPWGLRAMEKAYLAKTKAFAKGWIEIQDEGSQMIAHVCNVQPGMQVLDYCAGAGGKTLALAAAMQVKGRIVAMDNDERRLNKGRTRYKKARVSDIIEVRPLTEKRHVKWLKRQKGTFDIVLCDVPCTGTGTWRRNPDMRWRTYGPSLEELTPIQAEILENVAYTVKPGGRLVYATCSLLPAENEHQVTEFLKRHPDFTVEPLNEALKLGTPYMRLTPHRHGTDGFFAAVLKKND